MKLKKHKCCKCNNMATWIRLNPTKEEGTYYCPKCIPLRSCLMDVDDWGDPTQPNVLWWERTTTANCTLASASVTRHPNSSIFAYIDEEGNVLPSVHEFSRSKNGFAKTNKEKRFWVNFEDIRDTSFDGLLKYKYRIHDSLLINAKLSELYEIAQIKSNVQFADYNLFMSHFGDYVKTAMNKEFQSNPRILWKFFLYMKNQLSVKKIAK